MVRLEKIAYEQIVNTAALGRARKLTTPAKWFTVNPLYHNRKLATVFFNKTWLGQILYPFLRAWFNYERAWQRDIFLQKGLTFEDELLHHDMQLRRDPFFEHIARESLHPYHWVLKARRRERYYKVETASRGFYVPEYLRSEAKTQTYRDYQRLFEEWKEFRHINYFSDMTPTARRASTPFIFSFDNLMNFGIWRSEAWERYFFTERDRAWYSPKQVEFTKDPRKYPYDLTTAEGKRQFERNINEVNASYPGIVAVQGQKFDFKKYYAELGV